VDQNTMMTLCDVIYHLCLIFKEASQEFAKKVAPKLIEKLGTSKEEDEHPILSLIGTEFYRLNIFRLLTDSVRGNGRILR
jgi:hypothetical protein